MPPSESGSWLTDVVLWLDRTSNSLPAKHQFAALKQYEPLATSQLSEGTILYLAYGSNLSSSVFRGNRGIKPLSAANVLVPELRLVWDVPGIPFAEPCYANARWRETDETVLGARMEAATHGCTDGVAFVDRPLNIGLVGVVYEITLSDFASVLRSEGQGYCATEVECCLLERGSLAISRQRDLPSIRAYAVLSAQGSSSPRSNMQPSRRYLDLLINGAREHGLPEDYTAWLRSQTTYSASTQMQLLGKSLFSFLWFGPLIAVIFLERAMADKTGMTPRMVNQLVDKCFAAMWLSHDWLFQPVFGSGEHTEKT